MSLVRWPFGDASEVSLTADGAQAITVENELTVVDGETTEATGNRTLNLTVSDEIGAGAMLFIKSKTNGTETTIFGTSMQGATITGVAGKTKTVLCIYDGSNFVEAGTPIQID
ncbi:hypothetical protein [uncultured Draconibacterium sp.]|uniref:hypothetical protein n=1 Tax=uncultured Draconibacterium sp. TaxID=1573823 RepID=UPI0032170385